MGEQVEGDARQEQPIDAVMNARELPGRFVLDEAAERTLREDVVGGE